mgnify:CR=1 FL=1
MRENKEILVTIGQNLKNARNSKGYTQEQMAEQLNVSSKFISMIERGCSGLSITNLTNICKILDIEPNSLFNGVLNSWDMLEKNSFFTTSLWNASSYFLLSLSYLFSSVISLAELM